jgi:hypothetical protein
MDLKLLGIALRVRCLWLHRTEPHRSWVALQVSVDAETMTFFDASIQFILDDGKSIFF